MAISVRSVANITLRTCASCRPVGSSRQPVVNIAPPRRVAVMSFKPESTWSKISAMVASPTALAVLANAALVGPAHAAGKLFDFNATLPVMMAEFLALMFALDKILYTPVSQILDERDEMMKKKLEGVKGNTSEIEKLQQEAEQELIAARQSATAMIAQAKKETEEELNAKLAEAREKLAKELSVAMNALDDERTKTLSTLEAQVEALSEDIVKKVIA